MLDPKPLKITSARETEYVGPDPQPVSAVGSVEFEAIQFDLTPGIEEHGEGTLHWDTELHTVELGMGTSQQSVGFETYMPVRNDSGATIPNGTAIRITGQIGNRSTIAPDTGEGLCAGVTTYDIPNNTFGRVTTFGYVNHLDTGGFSAGDAVFSDTDGSLTTGFTPSFVGFIGNVHPTMGSVLVRTVSFRIPQGTTANRPVPVTSAVIQYFDTTLGLMIYWSGGAWVNALGVAV